MRLPLAALALCAACTSSGTASAPATHEVLVYVFNLYGEEQGRTDQRPANLVLSEFSTLNKLAWQTWGPATALGRGKLSGTWCLPDCLDHPYDATVTLSAVIPVRGKGYFTKYQVSAPLPDGQRHDADLAGKLPVPRATAED